MELLLHSLLVGLLRLLHRLLHHIFDLLSSSFLRAARADGARKRSEEGSSGHRAPQNPLKTRTQRPNGRSPKNAAKCGRKPTQTSLEIVVVWLPLWCCCGGCGCGCGCGGGGHGGCGADVTLPCVCVHTHARMHLILGAMSQWTGPPRPCTCMQAQNYPNPNATMRENQLAIETSFRDVAERSDAR